MSGRRRLKLALDFERGVDILSNTHPACVEDDPEEVAAVSRERTLLFASAKIPLPPTGPPPQDGATAGGGGPRPLMGMGASAVFTLATAPSTLSDLLLAQDGRSSRPRRPVQPVRKWQRVGAKGVALGGTIPGASTSLDPNPKAARRRRGQCHQSDSCLPTPPEPSLLQTSHTVNASSVKSTRRDVSGCSDASSHAVNASAEINSTEEATGAPPPLIIRRPPTPTIGDWLEAGGCRNDCGGLLFVSSEEEAKNRAALDLQRLLRGRAAQENLFREKEGMFALILELRDAEPEHRKRAMIEQLEQVTWTFDIRAIIDNWIGQVTADVLTRSARRGQEDGQWQVT